MSQPCDVTNICAQNISCLTISSQASCSGACNIGTLGVQDKVSFFSSAPIGKQTIDGSLESVVSALVNLGLCQVSTPTSPCPCADPNPTLAAGPFPTGDLTNSRIRDISIDKDTLVVGTNLENGGEGSALVFTRSNGVWSQQGPKLVGADSIGAAQQGTGVSVHGDTLVIGGPMDDGGKGAVWVYTRNESVWTQQGPKITVENSARFGTSVHIRGNTLVVGSPQDNSGQGSFSVFKRFEGQWIPEQTKIIANDIIGEAHFGAIIKVCSQEHTIAVAGNWDNGSFGAVWVYRLVNDVWVQDGAKITGNDTDNNPPVYQGYNVAISENGNYLAFSGAYDAVQDGAVWTFEYSNGVWTQTGPKFRTQGPLFGLSMDMNNCGNLIVVGNTFSFMVFKKVDGVWNFLCERAVWEKDQFGSYITLDGSGSDVAVSSLDIDALNVYIYKM